MWLAHALYTVRVCCRYDVYVLGVQEAVSDNVFDAFAQYTGEIECVYPADAVEPQVMPNAGISGVYDAVCRHQKAGTCGLCDQCAG